MWIVHPKSGVLVLRGLERYIRSTMCILDRIFDDSLENCESTWPLWPVNSMNRLVTSGVKIVPSQPANEAEVS